VNQGAKRVIKAVGAVAVLFALLMIVWGWWGDYRSAPRTDSGSEASRESTAPAEGEKAPAEEEKAASSESKPAETKPVTTVVVRTDGLNFRKQPAANGDLIGSLDKGQKLVLVKKQGEWLQVKTSAGTTGWVSADPRYTEIREP